MTSTMPYSNSYYAVRERTEALRSVDLMMNFLPLNEMLRTSLQGKPMRGVSLRARALARLYVERAHVFSLSHGIVYSYMSAFS